MIHLSGFTQKQIDESRVSKPYGPSTFTPQKPSYTTNPSQDVQNILSSPEYLGPESWFEKNVAKPLEPASNWILNTTKPIVESVPFQAVAGVGQIPLTIAKESFFDPMYNMSTRVEQSLSDKTLNPIKFAEIVGPTSAQVGATAGLFAMGARNPGTLFGVSSSTVKTAAKSIFTATALTAGPVLFGSAFVNAGRRDVRENVEAFGTAALVTAPVWIPPGIRAAKSIAPNPWTARLETTPFSESPGLTYAERPTTYVYRWSDWVREPTKVQSIPYSNKPISSYQANRLSSGGSKTPEKLTGTVIKTTPDWAYNDALAKLGVERPTPVSSYMSNRLSTPDILSSGFRRPTVDTRTLPQRSIPDWAYEDTAKVIGVESKALKPITTTVTSRTSSPLNTGVPEGWRESSPGKIMPIGAKPISIPDFPYSSPSKVVTAFSPKTSLDSSSSFIDTSKEVSAKVKYSIESDYNDSDVIPVIPRERPTKKMDTVTSPLDVPDESTFTSPYREPYKRSEITPFKSPQEQTYANPLLTPDEVTSADVDVFVNPSPNEMTSSRANLSPFGLTETNTRANTNLRTLVETEIKTDVKTEIKTSNKAVTKEITDNRITNENPLLDRTPPRKPIKETPPKSPVFPNFREDDDEEKFNASNPPAGTITWRQGKYWKAIYPPYDQDKPVTLKNPPAGATVRTGIRSAYHTAQVLKGQFNGEVYVDLGAQDIKFIGQGETADIQFNKGGQYTNVGRSNPSKTLGMSVRNKTKTRRINKNVA